MDARAKKIARLEAELASLGYHVVLAIDRDNIGDILEGRRRGKIERNWIAEAAAADLANNELGNLPITEAVKYAAKEYAA
jgi:hypothetical protein